LKHLVYQILHQKSRVISNSLQTYSAVCWYIGYDCPICSKQL